MSAEEFWNLVSIASMKFGTDTAISGRKIVNYLYDKLHECAVCGGGCRLSDDRKCSDCRRNEAQKRGED